MRRFVIFCLFLIHTSIWSQIDTASFVIRTYGFQSWDDYDEIEDSIATNWNIIYLPVAGCLVTDHFVDSINRLNSTTYLRLEAHYGLDWKERFNKEVNNSYTHIQNQKENTFQETTDCATGGYYFKVFENLNRTKIKFVIASKKTNPFTSKIHIIGLQHMDPTILYRGYENLIEFEFGNLKDTSTISIKSKGNLSLTDTCLTSSKIRLNYRVSGFSKTDTLFIETSEGQIHQQIFNVKNLETPKLYLNNLLLDSILKISDLNHKSVLSMRMEKSCLIPEQFTIRSWEITYSERKRYVGSGNRISSSIIRKLKKLQPGSNFCIQVIISSKDSVLRKKTTCVSLI
jgi:hypothetical protein